MTRIRLLGKHGTCRGFEVSGHAGAGVEGNDLVCAAVSFLATTCANALESVAGEQPEVSQKDGYLRVALPEEPGVKASTILQVFAQGALDLAQAYPKHVHYLDELK